MKKATSITQTLRFRGVLFLLVVGFILLFSACEKDHDHNHDVVDTEKPVINLSTPRVKDTFKNGDTIRIAGTVTDNESLHVLTVEIKNNATNAVLFTESPTVHDLLTYTLATRWKANVSMHTDATLTITAQDHDNNVSTKTTSIHIHP